VAPPAKKRRGCLIAALIAIGLVILQIVIVVIAASGSKSTPSSSKTVTTAKPGTVHAIGETAKTGDFSVIVFGFRDPQPPSQFAKPPAGSHYVSVDVQVMNTASSQKAFSSLLGFHLVDATNHQYDEELTDITPRPADGQVAPGQAVRGIVVFAVPDGTTGLQLRVQGSITASGAFFALK
jgi:hypothetical protein